MSNKIALTVKKPKNVLEKAIGLIGKPKAFSLLLQTRFGIHTFGVRFPIDVVVLNQMNTIVTIRKDLKPNRFFLWNPIFDRVLELPPGTIEKKRLAIGCEVELHEEN